MPGESPGRDWDALLTEPEPDLAEILAAARARHRRKQRRRVWTAVIYIVIGLVFIVWSATLWWVLGQPGILLVPWLLGYPLTMWLTYLILERVRPLFIPPREWELVGEEV